MPTSASDATPTAFPVGFGPGTWHVSSEVAPGVYKATDISGTCEWARLSRIDGDSAEVLFEDSTTAPVTVAILPTDAGFRASEGCGRWVFQPSPTPTPTPTPLDFRAPELHTTLSSGLSHTCALRPNGTAVCWGSNFRGKSSPPQGERFISISSGSHHTCALRPDGAAFCWGDNDDGEASPPEGEIFASISAGRDLTCGVRHNGSVVCWGFREPRLPKNERFEAISIGTGLLENHGCLLWRDRSAVCWGYNGHLASSPPTGTQFMSISTGGWHTCALRIDGAPVCWATRGEVSPPEEERFVAISSGSLHTCGLRGDGSAVCWGSNEDGQASPPEGERFASISSGDYHTCALRPDGSAVCWGYNEEGEASPPADERFAVGRVAP